MTQILYVERLQHWQCLISELVKMQPQKISWQVKGTMRNLAANYNTVMYQSCDLCHRYSIPVELQQPTQLGLLIIEYIWVCYCADVMTQCSWDNLNKNLRCAVFEKTYSNCWISLLFPILDPKYKHLKCIIHTWNLIWNMWVDMNTNNPWQKITKNMLCPL